jgi:hypothetical protein
MKAEFKRMNETFELNNRLKLHRSLAKSKDEHKRLNLVLM